MANKNKNQQAEGTVRVYSHVYTSGTFEGIVFREQVVDGKFVGAADVTSDKLRWFEKNDAFTVAHPEFDEPPKSLLPGEESAAFVGIDNPHVADVQVRDGDTTSTLASPDPKAAANAGAGEAVDFDGMTVAELRDYATENNIDLAGATKKDEILAAIRTS